MRRLILTLSVILAVLSGAVGCKRTRIIPESTMSDIYADMFLADQWLNSNSRYRRATDTTWFYRPIFEKYGYGFEDYDASVTYYLRKPETYSKILKVAAGKLDREYKRLKKIDEILASRYKAAKFTAPMLPLLDSLAWASDTTILWAHYLEPVADTSLIDSVFIDSLRLDSLRLDSLRLDSLRLDSLRLDSLRQDALDTTLIRIFEDDTTRKASEVLRVDGPHIASPARHERLRKVSRDKDE